MTRFLAKGNIFYHGTYNQFDVFRPLSHFGSIYAAEYVLYFGCPKFETLEGLPKNMPVFCSETEYRPKIIPVKLRLNNTYELQDINALHDRKFYQSLLLFHFTKELRQRRINLLYDYIANDPFYKMTWKNVEKELCKDSLYLPERGQYQGYSSEKIDRYHLFLQRMIHYFESIGYDGFHYTNHFEDEGHMSYIPFRPESIIRLDMHNNNRVHYKSVINAKMRLEDGGRDLKYDEFCSVIKEDRYRRINSKNKLLLFKENKKTAFRFNELKRILIEKTYYSNLLFKEILPKVRTIGAVNRSKQICLFGIDLALSVHQDPLLVLLAIVLNDYVVANKNVQNIYESEVKNFLQKNYTYLLPVNKIEIMNAINKYVKDQRDDSLVYACLVDAIGIFNAWKNKIIPNEVFTPYGKILISLSEDKQVQYLKRQKEFLIKKQIIR